MPEIDLYEHYSLKELTSFKIGGLSRYLADIHSVNELFAALRFFQRERLPLFVLGGGSNTLVSDRGFQGLVVKMSTRGIEVLEENSDSIIVKVAAGENWDDFVDWAGRQGWWGIENLSHIPGNTGALAIQNVGAYGQEASQVIESLEVCEVSTGERRSFTPPECHFAYRQSIFNSILRGKFLILNTIFRLRKKAQPNLNYQDLKHAFGSAGMLELGAIRQAVIRIRQQKLPDPALLGNAGSFFKNRILSVQDFARCCRKVRETLGNEACERLRNCTQRDISEIDARKIPTALLLDICDLKDFQYGGAALYHKHPLIVINKSGHATARDIMELTKYIRRHVFRQTGIHLRPEPNLLGFSPEELREFFGIRMVEYWSAGRSSTAVCA